MCDKYNIEKKKKKEKQLQSKKHNTHVRFTGNILVIRHFVLHINIQCGPEKPPLTSKNISQFFNLLLISLIFRVYLFLFIYLFLPQEPVV